MAARTVRTIFTNGSSRTLTLKAEHLDHGEWPHPFLRPPKTIAVGETVEWESASDGVMTGTEGWAEYAPNDSKVHHIRVKWDNPFVGGNEFWEECTTEQLRVTGVTDGGKYDAVRRVTVKDAPLDFVEPPQMPAVFRSDDAHLDVFVNSFDRVMHRRMSRTGAYYAAGDWDAWWETLDRPINGIAAGVAAASWGPGRMDVAVINGTGSFVTKYYDDGEWTTWMDLGGEKLRGTPALVAPYPEVLVAFAVDSAGTLLGRVASGTWGPWTPIAGAPVFASSPGATYRRVDTRFETAHALPKAGTPYIEVFGLNSAGDVVKVVLRLDVKVLTFIGIGVLTPPEPLLNDGVGVAANDWEPDRVDVFFPAASGRVVHLTDTPTADAFETLKLAAQTAPAAAWLMPGDLHVFTFDPEYVVRHQRFFDQVWGDPDALSSTRDQRQRTDRIHVDEALGGWVEVSWNRAGNARFRGDFYATGAWSYHVDLLVALTTDTGIHVVFHERGHVAATFEPGDRHHVFEQNHQLPVIGSMWSAFLDPAFVVRTRADESMFAPLAKDLLLIVETAIGPIVAAAAVVAVVVVAGLELFGVLDENATDGVLRVSESVVGIFGPTGMLFAISAGAVANIGENIRDVTPAEYAFADTVFSGTLPPIDRLKISDSYRHNEKPPGYRAYTYPRSDDTIVLNMGQAWADPLNYNVPAQVHGQTFIHEMTHAWQIHNLDDLGLYAQFWNTFVASDLDNAYDFGNADGVAFGDLNLEQQASVVDHWFSGIDTYGGAVTRAGMDPASPLMRFITDNVRLGLPE